MKTPKTEVKATKPLTLQEIAQMYLDDLGQLSLERYKIQKSSFSHVEKLPKNATDIKKSDLEKWIVAMQKHLAPGTIKNIIKNWRRACEFAIERGLLAKNLSKEQNTHAYHTAKSQALCQKGLNQERL